MRRGRSPANSAAYFAAGIVVCTLTTEASASLRGYCAAYGHEAADRKTGIAGSAKSISATAVKKWQAAYDKALASCMAHYQVETVKAAAAAPDADKKPVKVASAPAAEKKPAKSKSAKPKPGTKAWADYCAAKYRSYDAATDKYKSYSGEYRACR